MIFSKNARINYKYFEYSFNLSRKRSSWQSSATSAIEDKYTLDMRAVTTRYRERIQFSVRQERNFLTTL